MGKHFYTTDPHEATVAIQNGRVLEGIACYVWPITEDLQPPIVPLYRFYKGDIDDHLYTTDPDAAPSGYTFELIACYVYEPALDQPPEAVPLYRYFNSQSGEHFYTTNPGAEDLTGFQPEGFSCYVYDLNLGPVPGKRIPFYREYTP